MRPAALGLLLLSACLHPSPAPATEAGLWLGGDVHLGDGPAVLFAPAPQLLQGAVGVINLEGPVGPPPPADGRLRLHNRPSTLVALRDAGVRVVGVANNHAWDAGPHGEAATLAALRAHGLCPAGGAAGAAVLSLGGLRVAITAHDLTGLTDLTGRLPPDLGHALRQARQAAPLLIATFHTTGLPSYLPQPVLRAAVEEALRAGATVVVAHGSHSLGAVERRGAAVIAWGLGNLRFVCGCTDEREALLLRLWLGPEGLRRVAVVPIEAGLGQQPARLSPTAGELFDLLESLGSTPLRREGPLAWL
ncbi:MAG: CapA family protein [Myxococcales bacterium]|nr:CapA family protein [Myxococcota bacterium]MDW8282202.1 CapA family protein [Myxococcales bacterium]